MISLITRLTETEDYHAEAQDLCTKANDFIRSSGLTDFEVAGWYKKNLPAEIISTLKLELTSFIETIDSTGVEPCENWDLQEDLEDLHQKITQAVKISINDASLGAVFWHKVKRSKTAPAELKALINPETDSDFYWNGNDILVSKARAKTIQAWCESISNWQHTPELTPVIFTDWT